MARSLDESLAPALVAPPVPTHGPELVKYAGGRRELVQQMTGLDHSPRRSEYDSEADWKENHTRWRSASRQAQRWDDEGKADKQRRGSVRGTKTLNPVQKGRIRRQAGVRRRRSMLRDGAYARIKAKVKVDTPKPGASAERTRIMPAPGSPGVDIPGDVISAILDALGDKDDEVAAEEFLPAFITEYGMPDGTEILSVDWLKIWPHGENEPSN